MSENNLTHDEALAIKKLLKKLGCDADLKVRKEFKKEIGELLCEKCQFPVHPNLPCEELVSFYNHVDEEYFRIVNLILKNGKVKKNRTGIDTIGVFGAQAKFDVDMNAFPILTTKKVWFKGIVHELLWFLKGDTNIKYLVDNDVHIWDEWAFKRACLGKVVADECKGLSQDGFIEKIKVDAKFAEKWGELGMGTYGGMWRDFPVDHVKNGTHVLGVDQIETVINKLKSNPDDRRMIVSAWHPYWVDHCALPPCHCMFHFNTEELSLQERIDIAKAKNKWSETDSWNMSTCSEQEIHNSLGDIPKRRLNCLLYQRSNDFFLGIPFNITSYSLLTAMVAHCVNMVTGTFTHTFGDAHIYINHLEQINLQMSRSHRKLPQLWLNPNVKNLMDFKYEDIKLVGYVPHSAIKAEIAV